MPKNSSRKTSRSTSGIHQENNVIEFGANPLIPLTSDTDIYAAFQESLNLSTLEQLGEATRYDDTKQILAQRSGSFQSRNSILLSNDTSAINIVQENDSKWKSNPNNLLIVSAVLLCVILIIVAILCTI